MGYFCDQLVSIGYFSPELVVQVSTREVKIADEELVRTLAGGSVSKVCCEYKCSVCSVGCASICFIV